MPSTRKVKRGGAYLEMVPDNTIPMGPTGGVMSYVVKQQGGKYHQPICHDLKKVETFSQVKQFWQNICPGAVMLYQNHIQKHELMKPREVKKIVVGYTRAFCQEVNALNCKKSKDVEKHLKKLKEIMREVKALIIKVEKEALNNHKMIVDRHVDNVLRYKSRVINMEKREKTKKRIAKSLKQKYKKMMKKTRKMMKKNKQQKGGYNQFLSNVPYSASYQSVTGPLEPSMSALANPQYIQGNNVHGIDNYNHYVGKGTETGVFESAPALQQVE
jgi:superoxide dismutase